MTVSYRKVTPGLFDIKYVLLPCLWATRFSYEGAIWPNLVSGNAGVKSANFR